VQVNRPAPKPKKARPDDKGGRRKGKGPLEWVFGRRNKPEGDVAEAETTVVEEAPPEPVLDDQAALREQGRELEGQLAAGGVTDPKPWAELGLLKELLDEHDDASACLETSLFYESGERDAAKARSLEQLRTRLAPKASRDRSVLELALDSDLAPSEASLLGARVLRELYDGGELEDGLLPQVVRLFSEPRLPVSRRLAWLVEWSCHRATRDKLGLTRAKEALVGQLNDGGLSESFDLPRFVRYALALGDDGAGGAEKNRLEQLTALERLWNIAATDLAEADAPSAFRRVIFAVGFARLGAAGMARELVQPVEAELPAHDRPNRELFRLYLARMAHAASDSSDDAWKDEVRKLLSSLEGDAARRPVEWLRKRSDWLRDGEVAEPEPWLRPNLQRELDAAEENIVKAGRVLGRVLEEREYFDYEITSAVERLVRAALRTGNDGLIEEVVDTATARLGRIGILAHRAKAIGTCLEGAAAVGDLGSVHRLLDRIVDVAQAPRTPSVRALLQAVTPALLALRRLGASGSAEHFLRALEPVARAAPRESISLLAHVADGFLQLGDRARADAILDEAIERCLEPDLDYSERDAGAEAILRSSRHWPVGDRADRAARLLEDLEGFRDTFTVRVYFPTHQLLFLERMVDAMVDDVTFSSDRVRAFLDAEELATRRRVVEDWSAL
jgi:hypothetical protein